MTDHDFVFDRTISIRARPSTVWHFLSEPGMFARWWGEGSTIEARVGAPVKIVYAKTEGFALVRALKLTARLHLWTGLVLAAGAALTI